MCKNTMTTPFGIVGAKVYFSKPSDMAVLLYRNLITPISWLILLEEVTDKYELP